MASINLYTDKYEGSSRGFAASEVDLVTGQWRSSDVTSGYDYNLTGYGEYTNPITGDNGVICQIDIPLKGINLVNDVGDELAALGGYTADADGARYDDTPTEFTEQPDDWEYTYLDYFTKSEVTQSNRTRTIYNQVTSNVFPGTVYKFGTNRVSQHFFTYGGNFFSVKHFYQPTGTNIAEQLVPFWLGTYPNDTTTSVSKQSAPGFWSFNGTNGDIPFNIIPLQKPNYAWCNQATINITAWTSGTKSTESRNKMTLVAFTLPAGVLAASYRDARTESENPGTYYTDTYTTASEINFVGVIGIIKDASGIPQSARIWGITLDFWQPEGQQGNWGADTGIEGGDGTFNAPSDNRGDNNGSTVSDIAQSRDAAIKRALGGFVHVYTSQDFNIFMSQLYATGTGSLIQQWLNSMYNPLSAILACHALPSVLTPGVSARNVKIRVAGKEFDESANTPSSFVTSYHVGTADMSNKYFGAFPDFSPYTKCYLHLPYCGVIDIDTNAVMYGWLSVDYVCDILSGNICAYVSCCDHNGNYQILYTATGNCAYNIPMFSMNQTGEVFGKIVTGLAGCAAGAAIAGALPAASVSADGALIESSNTIQQGAKAANIAASGAMDMATSSRHMQSTGSLSGNISIITDDMCYLEVIRPQWSNPTKYSDLIGISSDISGTLNSNDFDSAAFGGFVKCKSADVSTISGATAEEKEMIENLLLGGIHL